METSFEFAWVTELDQPRVSDPQLTITWFVRKPADDSANGHHKLKIDLEGIFGVRQFKVLIATTTEDMAHDQWEIAIVNALRQICKEGELGLGINVIRKEDLSRYLPK